MQPLRLVRRPKLRGYLWFGLVMLPSVLTGMSDLNGVGWRRGILLAVFGGPVFSIISFAGLLLVPLGHGGVIQPACATLGGLLLATFLLGEKFLVTRAIGALIIVCGLSVIGAEAVTTIGVHGIAGDLMFVLTGLMFATFGAPLRLWHIAPIPATAVISVLSLFAAPVHWALGRFRSHDCVGMAGKLPADRLAGCGGGARSNLFVRPHSRSVGSGFEPAGRRPSHGHIPIPALLPNRHRLL